MRLIHDHIDHDLRIVYRSKSDKGYHIVTGSTRHFFRRTGLTTDSIALNCCLGTGSLTDDCVHIVAQGVTDFLGNRLLGHDRTDLLHGIAGAIHDLFYHMRLIDIATIDQGAKEDANWIIVTLKPCPKEETARFDSVRANCSSLKIKDAVDASPGRSMPVFCPNPYSLLYLAKLAGLMARTT